MSAFIACRSVQIAEANVSKATSMQSSALLCAQDARTCLERGDHVSAHRRALRSLEYSLGACHPITVHVLGLT